MTFDNTPSDINTFLNEIVNGDIENYTIDFEGNGEKGGNFLSDILYVKLRNKTSNKEIPLVIKQSFPNLDNPIFRRLYKNEIHFYQGIWKRLNDFQKAHNVGFDNIPKCVACDSTEGQEKIALENLKYQGFDLHDKSNPLTKNLVEVIMRSYGMFHAISFAFRELHPEEYAGLVEPCKPVSFKHAGDGFGEEFKKLIKLLENEIDVKILEKMERYVTDGKKIFEDSLVYTGDTPLLVQGDCWSNNMMFKFNDQKKVENMRFLDFQFTTSGSPVSDLSYSLYSGASKDVIDNLDFYLKIYHDSFSNTLEKFGLNAHNLYSFKKLKEEWKQHSRFGFMMSLFIWKMKYVDKNTLPSLKDGDGPDQRAKMTVAADKSDIYKQIMKSLFTHMYDNGYL